MMKRITIITGILTFAAFVLFGGVAAAQGHHRYRAGGAIPPALRADFACIRHYESGGDYQASGDEYLGGAYQFNPVTWWSLGYSGYAAQHSMKTQDIAAVRLERLYGWSPWQTAPLCGL